MIAELPRQLRRAKCGRGPADDQHGRAGVVLELRDKNGPSRRPGVNVLSTIRGNSLCILQRHVDGHAPRLGAGALVLLGTARSTPQI